MKRNILSNNAMADRFELRKQMERLQPIGRMYFEKYEHIRVDEKTIKLVKPANFVDDEIKKLPKREKSLNMV